MKIDNIMKVASIFHFLSSIFKIKHRVRLNAKERECGTIPIK